MCSGLAPWVLRSQGTYHLWSLADQTRCSFLETWQLPDHAIPGIIERQKRNPSDGPDIANPILNPRLKKKPGEPDYVVNASSIAEKLAALLTATSKNKLTVILT